MLSLPVLSLLGVARPAFTHAVCRAAAGRGVALPLAISAVRSGGRRALRVRACAEPAGAQDVASADLKSDFLSTMQWRGFLSQATDLAALDKTMAERPVAAYLGFDATASSLHVGSLLQIMLLRHFQRCGHKPIVLVGGGTTKVGDPSGKDASRQLLTEAKIGENIDGITRVFSKFLTFGDGPTDAMLVNNDAWLSDLNYLDFLREYGSKFTINRMLTFESVKQRLARESPLSFLEFNYMILQAYDFLELHRRHKVELQFGGSDQWGNIVNGVELTRKVDGGSVFGVTAPLLTTSDGKKMGKTADGAVWLNEELLPPFDYWQFWRNTADADVGRFLRIFTELERGEIERLESLKGAEINQAKASARVARRPARRPHSARAPHAHNPPRRADPHPSPRPQIRLADEATAMLHGADCLAEIKRTADTLFSSGGALDDTASLPRVSLSAAELEAGVPVIDLFLRLEFGKSKGEVRRLVSGGGARLNDEKIQDAALVVDAATFGGGNTIKLSQGKKKHGIIELL